MHIPPRPAAARARQVWEHMCGDIATAGDCCCPPTMALPGYLHLHGVTLACRADAQFPGETGNRQFQPAFPCLHDNDPHHPFSGSVHRHHFGVRGYPFRSDADVSTTGSDPVNPGLHGVLPACAVNTTEGGWCDPTITHIQASCQAGIGLPDCEDSRITSPVGTIKHSSVHPCSPAPDQDRLLKGRTASGSGPQQPVPENTLQGTRFSPDPQTVSAFRVVCSATRSRPEVLPGRHRAWHQYPVHPVRGPVCILLPGQAHAVKGEEATAPTAC